MREREREREREKDSNLKTSCGVVVLVGREGACGRRGIE